MDISTTLFEKYVIFNLPNELRVNILPHISPMLSNFITENANNDIVLNLSCVNFIDSSAISLMVNIHKRMLSRNKKLYLLNTSDSIMAVFRNVKLDKIFSFANNCDELDAAVSAAHFNGYLPFSNFEKGMRKLSCICPVCGSVNVHGYVFDDNDYDWKWDDDYLFPSAFLKGTPDALDIFGLMPIVCTDCFMCSIEVADFHLCKENEERLKSELTDDAVFLLSKAMPARKKMMELDVIIGEDFFLHPRRKITVYSSYLLAESCVRTVANKKPDLPYKIGYLNYIISKYAPSDKKQFFIDNCRTWLTQVINEKERYNLNQLSKAYYILILAAASLNKEKEASILHSRFSDFIETLPPFVKSFETGINSPGFWFSHAGTLLEKQMASAAG